MAIKMKKWAVAVATLLAMGGMTGVPVHAQGANSCFPNDGDCDEPNGLDNCPWGTDTNDCSNPNSNFGTGSGFAGSTGGTSTAGGSAADIANSCFPNDGDCDEPNGLDNCAWGTDTNDCSNPNSNFGTGSGFAGSTGGVDTTPPVQAQDPMLNPTQGLLSLASNFMPDPLFVSINAGGDHHSAYSDVTGGECSGYFADAPDLRLQFTHNANLSLSFYLDGDGDTVLLVNPPDGAWHCNDDSDLGPWGIDPALTFDTPMDGQYNIWVGSYSPVEDDEPLSARFYISELGTFFGMMERSFFGEDERVVMDVTLAPWNMIGLVEMTEGECTGTLIGPSTVLTAAHCFAADGEIVSPPVTFRAGYSEGSEVASSEIMGFHVPAIYLTQDHSEDTFDYAFVYLSEPLGDRLGWMDVGPLTDAELAAYSAGNGPDILQAGYSFDEPEYLTGNLDCPFIEVTAQDFLSHQCDTLSGDSGSPLFIADGNRFRIIGVESHSEPQPNAEFDLNLAMYAAGVVAELQRLAAEAGSGAPSRPLK